MKLELVEKTSEMCNWENFLVSLYADLSDAHGSRCIWIYSPRSRSTMPYGWFGTDS